MLVLPLGAGASNAPRAAGSTSARATPLPAALLQRCLLPLRDAPPCPRAHLDPAQTPPPHAPRLQVGDDPLDAPRYACNAPEELVTALCGEMQIRLSNYLRLA